jgi:hypothetical protein
MWPGVREQPCLSSRRVLEDMQTLGTLARRTRDPLRTCLFENRCTAKGRTAKGPFSEIGFGRKCLSLCRTENDRQVALC